MTTQKPNLNLILITTTFSLLFPCLFTTDQSELLFQQWSQLHGKSYEHAPVEQLPLNRFENFKRNLKYVAEHDTDRTGFTVGLNRFSDLSNDEFKDKYLSKSTSWAQLVQLNNSRTSSVFNCDAPSFLDWRNDKGTVFPIKDHGCDGRCRTFSLTDAIEENDVENEIINIDGYIHVEPMETALLCATVDQPISVGIDGSSIDFQLYTGGIYDGACSSNPDDINHVVTIVGYGSEGDKDYWIVKNSWGTTWGMDGYVYIRRNTDLPYGVCAINAMASYPSQPTLASSPSPSPSSTPPPASPPSPSPSPPPSSPPPPPPPPPSSPPPPPPNHPPPPPGPAPSKCGAFTYCHRGQTCCCLYEFLGHCLIQGCCQFSNAVCCPGSDYCCPVDYPICDSDGGLCLKDSGDNLGVALSKKRYAQHILPWSKLDGNTEVTYQALKWRRNGYAAAG